MPAAFLLSRKRQMGRTDLNPLQGHTLQVHGPQHAANLKHTHVHLIGVGSAPQTLETAAEAHVRTCLYWPCCREMRSTVVSASKRPSSGCCCAISTLAGSVGVDSAPSSCTPCRRTSSAACSGPIAGHTYRNRHVPVYQFRVLQFTRHFTQHRGTTPQSGRILLQAGQRALPASHQTRQQSTNRPRTRASYTFHTPLPGLVSK